MKYSLLSLATIATAIALSSQSAQASAYRLGSTSLEVWELPGGGPVGTGRYETMISGQPWRGTFTLTASTVGTNRVYTGNFTDSRQSQTQTQTQTCQGTLKLTRPIAITNNPTPMTARWTIGAGGVNCPSPIGPGTPLNLVEAVPVAVANGDFLPTATNGDTLMTETAGIVTWPKWKVVDPTGLNCRLPAPNGPITRVFAYGSIVEPSSPIPSKFIIAGGNPWLITGKNQCSVRAKNTYLKPVVMPF
jgi:hypothetical protein